MFPFRLIVVEIAAQRFINQLIYHGHRDPGIPKGIGSHLVLEARNQGNVGLWCVGRGRRGKKVAQVGVCRSVQAGIGPMEGRLVDMILDLVVKSDSIGEIVQHLESLRFRSSASAVLMHGVLKAGSKAAESGHERDFDFTIAYFPISIYQSFRLLV